MPEPKFLADEMLGTLARWLRIMGYDTEYARDMADDEILQHAAKGDRFILTRDRELARRAGGRAMLVRSDDGAEQLEDVVRRFGLEFDENRTRCTMCNSELAPVTPEEASEQVPPRVLERHNEFLACPSCGRMYWKGTHWTGIREHINEAVRKARGNSGPR